MLKQQVNNYVTNLDFRDVGFTRYPLNNTTGLHNYLVKYGIEFNSYSDPEEVVARASNKVSSISLTVN